MKWVPFDTAKTYGSSRVQYQVLVLGADLTALASGIPIPPRLVPTDEGPPAPMRQWYGFAEHRLVIIECPVDLALGGQEIVLYTPFPDPAAGGADWTVLLELQVLPPFIFVQRPAWIQSRCTVREHAVLRSNPRGWDDVVYLARTGQEAIDFLNYLRQDPWNKACLVGKADAPGEWAIIQEATGGERVVGAYPDKSSALRVACDMTLRPQHHGVFVVREITGAAPGEQYRVANGHATKASASRRF